MYGTSLFYHMRPKSARVEAMLICLENYIKHFIDTVLHIAPPCFGLNIADL